MKHIPYLLMALFFVTACSGGRSFNADSAEDSNEKVSEPQVPVTTTTSTSTTSTTVSTTTTLPPGACAPTPAVIPGGIIVINEGTAATNSLSVKLKLSRDGETGKMKISNNANCECGTWERYSEEKVWTLIAPNSSNTISVQYKDFEGAGSQCVKATIVHDTLAPTIQLGLNSSNSYWAGDNTGLKIQVTDTGSGLQSVICKLNGATTICAAVDEILFQRQKVGAYVFEVSASDALGNSSSSSINWEMKQKPDFAPEIQLALDSSNSYLSGDDTKLKLSVLDKGDGIRNLVCKLNGVASACVAGINTLTFVKPAVGSYVFEVSATNVLGKPAKSSIDWKVNPKILDIRQNVEIKSNNKVDILIVDDNSASMEYEQKSMANRMSTFLNQLQGLDWQIAITTTDPVSTAWGDGRLLPMKGLTNQYVITSNTPAQQAQKVLGDTIQRTETGSSSEQGIFATYRAIERSLETGSSPHKSFFRNDANFATIVISDEDESAKGPKNIPENLINFVKSTWASKIFAFHSIITKSGDKKCLNTNGATYGVIYEKLSRLLGNGTVGGSLIGSVCAADYGSQLKGIGDSVQEMQRIMNLQCAPIGPAASAVVVTLNGNNYTAPYQVQGLKLVFNTNLPKGSYTLQYQCNP